MNKTKKQLTVLNLALLCILLFVNNTAAQNDLTTKIQELADKLTSTTSGKVIDVDGAVIYINLGEKDSIYEGAKFEVVRLGDVMMLGNKPYYKEKPAGIVQVTRVRKDFSLAKLILEYEPIRKSDKVYQVNSITPTKLTKPIQSVKPQQSVIIVSGINLQSVFRRLKNGGFAPGPYDEHDLSLLAESIKRFQKVAKLKVTGKLDAPTWTKMQILYDPLEASTDSDSSLSKRSITGGVKKIRKIALMEFNYGNSFNNLTRNIYESLAVYFIQKGFQVVERAKLDEVLLQQKLNYSGLIDISTAQKLGKLMGSEIVLVGSLSDMGNIIAIRARMVDVAKGLALTAAEVTIEKTPNILEATRLSVVATPGYKQKQGSSSVHASKSGEFSDDFKRGPHKDWEKVSGDWTMTNGKFTVATIREKQGYAVYLKNKKWRNLKMAVKVNPGYLWPNYSHEATICPRATDARNKICFTMYGGGGFDVAGWRGMQKGQWKDTVGKVENKVEHHKQVEIVIEIRDNVYQAYMDGNLVSEYYSEHLEEGSISLGMYYESLDELTPITFDDIKVTPLN